MNKKFLSAILFGALMVTSTGTFVSCKDYDDDIDELWDAVGGKASAEDLKNQIDSMKTLLDDASTAAAKAKEAADEALRKANEVNDLAAAAEATAKAEAAAAKDAAIKEAKAQVSALEQKLTEAMNQKVDQSKFNELSAQVANLQAIVEGIAGKQLKSLVFVPSLYMDGVESFEAKYMPYKALSLKTADVTATYNRIDYKTSEANDIAENLATTVTVNSPTMYIDYHMNPTTAKVADFKDNLSFVSDDKDFVATGRAADANPKATYKTHGKGVLTVGVNLDATQVKNQAENQFIGYEGNQGLITVLALQANVKGAEGDTIVTSDYAGVYASQVKVEAIAYGENAKIVYTPATVCDEPTTGRHLFAHVKDAIEAEPTVNVAWNSSIDLNTLTCTHYLSNSASSFGNNGEVKVWANGEEKDFNLAYEYTLVDYKGGQNATSQSQNAQLLNGSVLRPCGVVSSTGQASGVQGIETVGRMPLVRVTLHDTQNNNQIVAIGYIKLNIVESEIPKETAVFDKGNFYYSCATQDVKLTWSETQTELLGLTALTSKDTFDALYELEGTRNAAGEVTDAVQYAKKADGTYVVASAGAAALPFKVGVVAEVVDPTAPTTTCLKWSVEQVDFAALREYATVNAAAKTITYAHTVYVKYVGKSTTGNTGAARTPIYVPVKVVFNYPYGTLDNKLANKWYAANSLTNGDAEIHVNVEVPKTTVEIEGVHGAQTAACHFHSDLDSYFKVNATKKHAVTGIAAATAVEGDAPTFGVPASFTAWQDAKLAYVYYFTAANDFRKSATEIAGNSGKKYNLYIGSAAGIISETALNAEAAYDEAYQASDREYNYNVLWATEDGAAISTAKMVAVITEATGVVTYQENDYAKDLLNLVSHKDLAKTLTAEIGVAAFNECANLLPLANKTFDAKFLRPVDIVQGEVRNFTDAVDGNVESTTTVNGAWAYVLNLVTLSDWRDQAFIPDNLDYFNYYGVKEIKVDVAKITTDMDKNADNSWKLLKDVNQSIYFTYEDATGNVPATTATLDQLKANYGKLKYFNNTGNTTEFNVSIPVTVVYTWGEITIDVPCHVGGTLNN